MNLSERDFPTPGIVVIALLEMKDQEKNKPLDFNLLMRENGPVNTRRSSISTGRAHDDDHQGRFESVSGP